MWGKKLYFILKCMSGLVKVKIQDVRKDAAQRMCGFLFFFAIPFWLLAYVMHVQKYSTYATLCSRCMYVYMVSSLSDGSTVSDYTYLTCRKSCKWIFGLGTTSWQILAILSQFTVLPNLTIQMIYKSYDLGIFFIFLNMLEEFLFEFRYDTMHIILRQKRKICFKMNPYLLPS